MMRLEKKDGKDNQHNNLENKNVGDILKLAEKQKESQISEHNGNTPIPGE